MPESTKDPRAAIAAIARPYARCMGYQEGERVGSPILIGALAKYLGERQAEPILQAAGIHNTAEILAAIPSGKSADNLPALLLDAHLLHLLQNELADFWLHGRMSPVDALKVLLDPQHFTDRAREHLTKTLGNRQERKRLARPINTKLLLRRLSAYYQERYHFGLRHHRIKDEEGLSDFVTGKADRQFRQEVAKLYSHETEALQNLFGSPEYRRSPLYHLREEYGVEEGHILCATLLAEIGQVGAGPLSVNEIAWILDPKYYHRTLGIALNRVRSLRMLGLVDVQTFDDKPIRMQDRVYPTDKVVENFLRFLRDADALTPDEIQDCLLRLPCTPPPTYNSTKRSDGR